MADLPDWLLALLGGQQNNPQAAGPSAGGLLAGAMPPPMGGLLTAPRPVPVDPGMDSAADPNTPIRLAARDLTQGRSVATGGTDQPDTADAPATPTSGTNVVGTPASGTTEASSPGFLNKAGQFLGSLYGGGGPGDALIQLGAGIASPEGWAKGVAQASQNMGNNQLNQARLQAFKLQLAQQQAGQTATASYLKGKGASDAEIAAAINGAAAGNGDLLKNLITRFSGNDKYSYITRPDNSVVGVNTADPADVKPILPAQDPENKPFVMGQDLYGSPIYGTMKNGVPTPLPAIQGQNAPAPAPAQTPAATTPSVPGQPAPTTAPQGTPSPDAPSADLHGEEYLKTLPSSFAGQVKAIAEGREQYPTGMTLRTPYGQRLTAAVNQYDPEVDAGLAQSRFKTRQAFTSGGPNTPASVITAGNTAIQHLGHLSDAAENISQNATNYPLVNQAKNTLARGSGGGLPLTTFNNILGRYAEEATKFYRGTGGTESDVARDIKNLNDAQSPAQLREAIRTQVDLLNGKVNALQDQWHNGMGKGIPDFPVLSPKSQEVLDLIEQRAKQGSSPAAPQAPRAFPSWSRIGGAT